MMKKLLAIIAAAVATSATIPAFADTWTDPDTGIEWTYTVTNGRAFLGGGTYQTPAVANSAVDIAIPDTIDVYSVGGISAFGFYNFPNLTNIVISSSVESIGANAFSFCRKLKTVEIPGSVIEIGRNAFYACYDLEEVVLNEGLREIGSYAFQNDHSLDEITIPNSVTNIQSMAFDDMSSIRSVVIGTGVGKIGNGAFGRCQNLTDVVFLGDRNAIDMELPSVFVGTPYLEGLEFSLFIRNGNYLSGFTGVCPETVNIPDGVSYIANTFDGRFPSVTNLVNLSLPTSITYMNVGIFSGCTRLQKVTFGSDDWYYRDDMMMAFQGTPFFDTLPFRPRVELRLNDGETVKCYVVDYIGKCPAELDIEAAYVAQWEANRQRELDMSGYDIGEARAIEGIAEGAFDLCDLRRVVLPAGLSVIEDGAFYDCTNLTHVVFSGNAPEEISEHAFDVHILGHYNERGEWVEPYYGPNPNCTVYVPANSTGWGVDIPGEWMGMPIRYSAGGAVEDGVLVSVSLGGDTEYTVPSGVTNIAANAFAGCGNLERVVIPDGVSSIEGSAFDGCGKLWAKWFKTLERLSEEGESPSGTTGTVALTVTNVVVHYVTAGVPSAAVAPPQSTGIVNVIAEVCAGGTVAIPSEWAAQYPSFEAKFGSDFTAAVTKPTGKRDGAGNAMQVWQDFVAGTDPTKEDDVFTASITFDADGRPVIGWSPMFSDPAEAAKRVYRKFGKVRLQDKDWTPFADGEEENYNFFKVTVEMK